MVIDAFQMGGYGHNRGFSVERYGRDACTASFHEGSSETQRLIIAREILNELSL